MYEPILPAKGGTAVGNPWPGMEVGWGRAEDGVMCGFGLAFSRGLTLCSGVELHGKNVNIILLNKPR